MGSSSTTVAIIEVTHHRAPLATDVYRSIAVNPVSGAVAISVGTQTQAGRSGRLAVDVYSDPLLKRVQSTFTPPQPLGQMQFTRDGEWLAAGAVGKLIFLRSSDGALVRELKVETTWPEFSVSPDKQRVATSSNLTVNVWNVKTGEKERSFLSSDAVFAPNGVLVLQLENRTQFVEAATGNELLLPGL